MRGLGARRAALTRRRRACCPAADGGDPRARAQAWSAFYEQRWAAPACPLAAGATWQARYGRKVRTQAAYGGRARQENLFGHRAGVRCLGLLPGRDLLATGAPGLPPRPCARSSVPLWPLPWLRFPWVLRWLQGTPQQGAFGVFEGSTGAGPRWGAWQMTTMLH